MEDRALRTSMALALVAIALSAGCSVMSMDTGAGSFHSYFLPRPQHEVWDALVATLEERRIPVARKDRGSFRLVTKDLMAHRDQIRISPDIRFADCPPAGTPPGGASAEGAAAVEPASSVLTVTLRVKPAGTNIALRLRSVAPDEDASGQEQTCESTRTVEQKVVAGIQDRLMGREGA